MLAVTSPTMPRTERNMTRRTQPWIPSTVVSFLRRRVLTLVDIGNAEDRIPYNDFMAYIQRFDVATVSEWCKLCDGVALFCTDLRTRKGSGSSSSGGQVNVEPTVAGAIGAAVTLTVVGIIFLVAVLLGGIRFHRTGSKVLGGLGGFKGAEKMSSDTDLAYAKGGARHERTGSWELRGKKGGDVEEQSEAVRASSDGITARARDLTHPSKNMDDDAISEIGHSPVKPREF